MFWQLSVSTLRCFASYASCVGLMIAPFEELQTPSTLHFNTMSAAG